MVQVSLPLQLNVCWIVAIGCYCFNQFPVCWSLKHYTIILRQMSVFAVSMQLSGKNEWSLSRKKVKYPFVGLYTFYILLGYRISVSWWYAYSKLTGDMNSVQKCTMNDTKIQVKN